MDELNTLSNKQPSLQIKNAYTNGFSFKPMNHDIWFIYLLWCIDKSDIQVDGCYLIDLFIKFL